ncbi:MAG: hypothetical protein KAI66_08850, partial [Lentisphaeria bacterium]|nr:hypothetical protein [Lentisphaeria bacterium]
GFWSRTYRFTVYAVRPYVLNAALVDDMRRSNILSTYYAQIRFRPRGNPVAYRLSDSDTFDGAITRQLITDGFDTSTDGADMEGSWLYKELPQPLDEYDLENGEFSRTYYLQMKNEDDVWSKTYRLNVKIDQPYISAAYLRNGDGRNNRITSLDHVTLELKSKELPIGFWLSDRRDFGHSRGTVLGPYKLRMMAPGVYQATVDLADFAGAASKKYYLKVLNSAGRESTVRTITVYAVRPKVTSVSPGKGQFVGGKIVVRGTGLNGGGRIVPNRWIRIGGIEVPTDDILSWTDTRIEFVVPEMDDRADNTLLEVKTQDFELPYQRVYKVFESPVGTWIMTATKPDGPLVSRKGEIVIFRHSDRYFLIEDEGVGELIATPDKGKLSGKVYYYDAELKGRQRPDLVLIPGVVFFESEIDYDGYDTVSLYLAETDDDTRVEDEMSGTWRESRVTANVTAERNDEVETVEDDTLPVYGCRLQASRRWPETYGDNRMETAWGSLAMLLLAERGADEVLLYTPPEAPRERHSVYVSPTPTGIWLEKNATLSKKFPFDVWHGKLSATLTDTQKTHVKLLIGDADEPMTLRLPPNPDDGPEDYESITCNHEDGGILDLSGRADVTFEYTLPDGMDPEDFYVYLEVFHDWKTADEIITETSDYDYDEGTNAITFTIDSDLFTAGRCYFAELEIVTLGIDGGAGASEESRDDPYVHLNGGKNYSYEFSLIASDDGQADDSYSVYYTRNGRFPDREVTWVRLANAVSGEQTVTLPDGAVGLRIRTHGRTEIASVSHPAEGDRPIVFLDFWNLDANWDAFWAAIVHTGNLEPGSSLDSGVLLLQNGTSIELSIRAEHAPGTHDVFRNLQGDITITPVVEFR